MEQLEAASHYWVATAGREGSPHARPVDGVVAPLYFGGGDVRWVRELRENPRISVHLESASDVVVILDGRVEWVEGPPDLVLRINEASQRRHGWDTAPLGLPARSRLAWTNLGVDATRWRLRG